MTLNASRHFRDLAGIDAGRSAICVSFSAIGFFGAIRGMKKLIVPAAQTTASTIRNAPQDQAQHAASSPEPPAWHGTIMTRASALA